MSNELIVNGELFQDSLRALGTDTSRIFASLVFPLRIWTAKELGNPQGLKSDLYFSIFEAFREHGIEMPFSQLDLHLRTVDASIIHTASKQVHSPKRTAYR